MSILIDFRAKLLQNLFAVIESPRVHRSLRNQRILDALIAGMSVPSHVRGALRDSGKLLARTMGLATEEDLRRLELDIVERIEGGVPARGSRRAVRFEPHGENP